MDSSLIPLTLMLVGFFFPNDFSSNEEAKERKKISFRT